LTSEENLRGRQPGDPQDEDGADQEAIRELTRSPIAYGQLLQVVVRLNGQVVTDGERASSPDRRVGPGHGTSPVPPLARATGPALKGRCVVPTEQ
jgi:hypothetical protein